MRNDLPVLLMTRPLEGTESFLTMCAVAGLNRFRVVSSPIIRIVPTGVEPDLTGVSGVIFTSRNGVRFAGSARDMPAFCLGAATTDAAKRAGWQAHHLGDDAKSLIAALLMSRPTGPLLHIGGVHRRGQVAQTLAGAGLPTTETDVYDQRPDALSQEALEALNGGNPVIVPLFSPRSARQFANQVKGRAALHVLAMSEAVMSEVRDVSATSRQVAQTPNADSMVEALAKLLLRVEAGDTAQ